MSRNLTRNLPGNLSRRAFLKSTAAAAGLACAAEPGGLARAAAAEPINFATWSAAVDTVKSHLAAFEAKTAITVNYSNLPWAQYRDAMRSHGVTSKEQIAQRSEEVLRMVFRELQAQRVICAPGSVTWVTEPEPSSCTICLTATI